MFTGSLFLGIGFGMAFGDVAVGALIGMGVDFLLMAKGSHKNYA